MTGPADPNDPNSPWASNHGPTGRPEQPPLPPNGLPPQHQLPRGNAPRGGFRAATARMEVSSATVLLSAVPWFFWSFVVVSWIAGIVGFGWGWILVVAWVLSGAAVFVPQLEKSIARYLFRLRQPTLVEQQRILPIWHHATVRAGVDEARFMVWIQESEDANATPTPGHTVAVTSWSLYNLPPSHLEAVLAHEVSHHLGGRAWLSLLSFWYSIPARCALIAVRGLVRLMKAVPAIGCAVGAFVVLGYLGVLLAILTFGDSFTFPILFLTPFVAPPILAWLSRRDVLVADRRAASMGYGSTLVQVLYGWQLRHQQTLGREKNRRSQFMSSTPSVAERVKALEEGNGRL